MDSRFIASFIKEKSMTKSLISLWWKGGENPKIPILLWKHSMPFCFLSHLPIPEPPPAQGGTREIGWGNNLLPLLHTFTPNISSTYYSCSTCELGRNSTKVCFELGTLPGFNLMKLTFVLPTYRMKTLHSLLCLFLRSTAMCVGNGAYQLAPCPLYLLHCPTFSCN